MKTLHAPHLGRSVKMGRRRPPPGRRRLHLAAYLRPTLPTPPVSVDYGAAAKDVLADIYANDQFGDCVIAGGYHVVGVETGNAGAPFRATRDQIIADYSAIGGYKPGDESTDQGCDEPTALDWWKVNGFANGTKLAGWVALDGANTLELKLACWLFENLYFGIELPDRWVNPFPGDHFTWDVAGHPDPQNGHCVVGYGYGPHGVIIDTWGLRGVLTFAAIHRYCVERAGGAVYALLTPDQMAKGAVKAPNGVAWADLINDFGLLAR